MNKIIVTLALMFVCFNVNSQIEVIWDQGVPLCPDDPYVAKLEEKLDLIKVRDAEVVDEKTR